METMKWEDGSLKLLDQTKLPLEVIYVDCRTAEEVADAIKTLKVRGAPAIGAAAAYGLALGGFGLCTDNSAEFMSELKQISDMLASTRPTAVNLFWALKRMVETAEKVQTYTVPEIKNILLQEAQAIFMEDLEMNRSIGRFGSGLVPEGARILTHCNAGALATAGFGTALGVIRAAHNEGKNIQVYADETRPLLQGARLTAWELVQDKIPVTLITDNMAGYLMEKRYD